MTFIIFGILLSSYVAAHAADLTVTKITSADEIQLSDNSTLHLQGISIASPTATAALQTLTANHPISLEDSATDRYGRISASAYVTDDKGQKLWLQGEMLKAGQAFVYPPTGAEPHLDDMLKLEKDARQAKRGIWAQTAFADTSADNAEQKYGQFGFVSGKVVKADRVKNKVYLNFGDDWRKDFTIAIAAHDLHYFRKAAIDPLSYEGKTIRVRGWVKRDFGPMITVTHPAQIEILN